MPGFTLDPDPTAVQLDEALRECEAEACALALLHTDVSLLELLEDPLLVLGCDARAGIGHRHLHVAVHVPGRHRDAAARGCELDRVRQNIEDDLANTALVAAHAVDVRRKLERELDAVLDRRLAHHHYA